MGDGWKLFSHLLRQKSLKYFILKVPASSAQSIRKGYLSLKTSSNTNATSACKATQPLNRFFSLLPDFVLYSFRSHTDNFALTATPLPGYAVLTGPELKNDSLVPEAERELTIKLTVLPSRMGVAEESQAFRKLYYFCGKSKDDILRYRNGTSVGIIGCPSFE